jgi:hypothetical protein
MSEPERLAEVVLRQGELKLAAQLQVAIAADHRATAFAGLFITLALAALSGAGLLWKLGSGYEALLAGLIVVTALLIFAAYLCVETVKPVDFWTAGNQPERWWSDDVDKKPLAECLRKESENYQKRIIKNNDVLDRNAKKFLYALRIGLASPLVLIAAYVARNFLFR